MRCSASLSLVDTPDVRKDAAKRWWPSTASASSNTRSMPIRRCRACASSSPSGWRRARPTGRSTSRVDGKDPQTVTAEARQICLDGLAHGKRYEVQVRAGLPSAVGEEKLPKTAELAVYVRDRNRFRARHGPRLRAAQPRPAGHSAGHRQHRARSMSRSIRIGDRSLAQTLQGGEFPEADRVLRARAGEGAQPAPRV